MRLASILSISILLAGATHASAATEPIGSAVTVVNLVTAQLARETRTLATGDDVRQNEVIEVGLDASSELKLKDDTKLALGAGSRLVLDRFVYDPDQSGGSILLNLTKGAFRFITGVAEKPAYVIRVPSASITVRGTIFDVFVQDDGRSWLLLHEGGVRICNDRGSCRNHNQVGKIVPITESGDLGKPSRWASLNGVQNISFDSAFPFVVSPPSVDPSPILTREQIVGTEPVKPYKPQEMKETDKPSTPGKRVDLPKIDLPKVNLPRTGYKDKIKDKLKDKLTDYVPKLIDRIKDRDLDWDDDDDIADSISAGGYFGKRHKSYMPD
jgi:hypothetical protein